MKSENLNKNFGDLKIKFLNHEKIKEFYSQAAQDLFVLIALNGKMDGTFLDIGCQHPIYISNTYLLENKFNWNGVLIDIDKNSIDFCNDIRKSETICDDATKINYELIFEKYKEIDYMSLDIDGIATLEVLKKIPLNNYKIKVITFEHDSYRFGDFIKNESRKIFELYGYTRICTDIKNENLPYEDWYVHPNLVNVENLNELICENKNWNEVLF